MMPSATSPIHPSSGTTACRDQRQELALLRAELDRLDDALHDMLMQRAAVVEHVAGTKAGVALRPGREAAILRRLLERHSGPLPRQALVRIWRELFSGTTAMQGGFIATVCDADPGNSYTQLAREHFGALTPLRIHRSPAQAIAELSGGTAGAAILPTPVEGEPPSAAWWTALLHRDEPRIHVVARLPFWTPRPEGAPRGQALVVSAVPPDPSGRDRSLIGLEIAPDVSRARLTTALTSAGFLPGPIILRRESGAADAQALVEVDGLINDEDARLAALGTLVRRPVILGAYAIPLAEEHATSDPRERARNA